MSAFAIICVETPTKFFELVNSFFEKESGKESTAASLVIHNSNKKPVSRRGKGPIRCLRKNMKIWNSHSKETRFANNGTIAR
jgi:hypothetical protein